MNATAQDNLLEFNYSSMPNVWFANYCNKISLKYGSSMEISSFIGFRCSKLICDKYGLELPQEINEILSMFYQK